MRLECGAGRRCGGVAIAGVPAVRVINGGARLPLVVRYAGTLDYPVSVSLAPRPPARGGCFDPGGPPNWSCSGAAFRVERTEQAGSIVLRDAVWCQTSRPEHRRAWTMKYEVTLTDRSGRTAGPHAVDLICDATNIP